MYGEHHYFTWGCQPAKSDSADTTTSKPGIRAATKAGLLGLLGREITFLSTLAGAKRAAVFASKSFDEVTSLVDEVRELEKSLDKLNAIYDLLKEV